MTSMATMLFKDEYRQKVLLGFAMRRKLTESPKCYIIHGQFSNYKNIEPPAPIRHTDISVNR